MDFLRIIPREKHLDVLRVNDEDDPRHLMQILIDSPEDLERETLRLVRWALQMGVGLEVPFREEMVTE